MCEYASEVFFHVNAWVTSCRPSPEAWKNADFSTENRAWGDFTPPTPFPYFHFFLIASHPAGWVLQVNWSLFIFLLSSHCRELFLFFFYFFVHYYYHVQLDSLTQGACATIHHTDVGQRERHVSLRRHFSMILSLTPYFLTRLGLTQGASFQTHSPSVPSGGLEPLTFGLRDNLFHVSNMWKRQMIFWKCNEFGGCNHILCNVILDNFSGR